MPTQEVKKLHQGVVDAIDKEKRIIKNHLDAEEDSLSFGERFADITFTMVSSWTPLVIYASLILLWIGYNSMVPEQYCFDKFPFVVMTLLLAGIASIQAPIIMISQHRQQQKNSKQIAANLKVENEILVLHRSINLLMEKQNQQILENQAASMKILQELQIKPEQKTPLG